MRQRRTFTKDIKLQSVTPVIIKAGKPEILDVQFYSLDTDDEAIKEDIMIKYDLTPDIMITTAKTIITKRYRMDIATFIEHAVEVPNTDIDMEVKED